MTSNKAVLLQLIVLVVVTCVTQIALAQSEAKSYAVFVVSYNSTNDDARGGVAGTAFFVSKKKAITAFHVLQEKSFEPLPGFEKAKVWLVHEGEAPIELRMSDIKTRPGHDMTEIEFRDQRHVRADRIFASAPKSAVAASSEVVTEGFVAETAGPILHRIGADMKIVAVPRLQRLQSRGRLLRSASVELNADDVKMNGVPCFEVSYQPVRGLSGGPLLVNGKVVGMNSFADPVSRARTWAVDLGAL